jgi:hypothetical protein
MTVDYSDIVGDFGAGQGDRLRAVALVGCTRPGGKLDCTKATTRELTALNDVGSDTLQVSVVAGAADGATPSSRTAGATVMALTSAADGSSGSFSQTTLSPSAEWVHGGSSGGFNWSYDLALPNAGVGGPLPAVGRQYSSQAVDGMNVNTNSQASQVGLG